jgi:hypothetical protein
MGYYRKKPVVIKAYKTNKEMKIETLEGTMTANPGDWIITGVNGEQYPCKPDIFEKTYEPAPTPGGAELLNFGKAIEALKEGKKVSRIGWNGKGMWVALMPALYLDKSVINARTQKYIGTETDLDSQPYIAMWTAQGKWQPGWLASQPDMLAEDWMVIE